MRELLLCLMTSLHVKNNLKMYKKCRKRGEVNAKRSVEKQGKEFIKKKNRNKKSCDFEYNLIISFRVKIAFQKKKNDKIVGP